MLCTQLENNIFICSDIYVSLLEFHESGLAGLG